MHYIPESGTFKLKNGIEMSARQYIEEFIMFELEKYNGDLDALMKDTLEGTEEQPERDGWTVPTHGQEKGVSIENFKKSIATKRREQRLGLNDLKKTQSDIKHIQHNRVVQKPKSNGQTR